MKSNLKIIKTCVFESVSAKFARSRVETEISNDGKTLTQLAIEVANVNGEEDVYYKLCDIIHNTLSQKDLDEIEENATLLLNDLSNFKDFVLFQHFKSLVIGDFSFLEQALTSILNNKQSTVDFKLELLNTYKNETFDFRRKIRPRHLDNLSKELIGSLNQKLNARDIFRQNAVNTLVNETVNQINTFNFKSESKNIVFILEEIQQRYSSTVNKLIFDWVYSVNTFNPEYNITILVTNDVVDGIIPGIKSKKIVNTQELVETLEINHPDTKVNAIYRDKNVELLSWLFGEFNKHDDLLGIVTFPSPRWPLASVLSQVAPTVGIELANGVNLNEMATIILPNGIPSKKTRDKYGDKLVEVPFPQIPFPKAIEYTRGQFNFSDTDFVIVSVGRHLFSRASIDIKLFLDRVVSLLVKHSNLKWFFIGEKNIFDHGSEYTELSSFITSGRVSIVSNEDDLVGFYDVCDLFAMPPIKGGGRGIGLAASCCLPCISFDISDGAKSFPKELVFDSEDMNSYFEMIERIYLNDDLKDTYSKLCRNIFGPELHKECSTGLIDAVRRACTLTKSLNTQ